MDTHGTQSTEHLIEFQKLSMLFRFPILIINIIATVAVVFSY